MACRLNIALCKQTLGDYSAVVDQCERVLSHEPANWKAQFRMAQALHALIKEKEDGSKLKTVIEFAKKAHSGNPSDPKIKDFYNQILKESGESSSGSIEEPTIVEEEVKSYACTPTTTSPSSVNQSSPFTAS